MLKWILAAAMAALPITPAISQPFTFDPLTQEDATVIGVDAGEGDLIISGRSPMERFPVTLHVETSVVNATGDDRPTMTWPVIGLTASAFQSELGGVDLRLGGGMWISIPDKSRLAVAANLIGADQLFEIAVESPMSRNDPNSDSAELLGRQARLHLGGSQRFGNIVLEGETKVWNRTRPNWACAGYLRLAAGVYVGGAVRLEGGDPFRSVKIIAKI